MYDVILAHNKSIAKDFLEKMEGKNPLFLCVIGTTQTAKIQGISAAGKQPEWTDYTPPADVELLQMGECICIPSVPVTPTGVPTPALITRSALKISNIATLVVNGGVKAAPNIPFLDLGGSPGGDIRTGNAVDNVKTVLQNAKTAGENLAKTADYLVIGESIPGGTTTALAVMCAMGIDAKGKVSSSLPNNPHELKIRTVEKSLQTSKLEFGSLKDDPLKAIKYVGDPMLPAFAGLMIGAADEVPILMAGGTQMGAVLTIVNSLEPEVLDNVALGTTRWVLNDQKSDLKGIVSQVADIPILAADLDFGNSNFEGLRAYEAGAVKEGVGAGGAAIAAMVKSRGNIMNGDLLENIERNYSRLVESDA